MRNGAGLIIPVHANLRLFLESLPARELDGRGAAGLAGLDGRPTKITALWNAIDRTGSDNVHVIFRTAGRDISAGKRGACAAPADLVPRRGTSAIGFERDRSGIYGGFPLLRAALRSYGLLA